MHAAPDPEHSPPRPPIPNEGPPSSSSLLHRWFVEYNPLYLVSALLVLVGMFVTSRGLAEEGTTASQVAVGAIAEMYAIALIGGAALLTRIGQRRPAVMLAVLTALYQVDLTLHTETCVNLGGLAPWATAGWLTLFVGKLFALAWAMKVRLGASVVATAVAGAFGLAMFPYFASMVDHRSATVVVGIWLVALVLVAPVRGARADRPEGDEVTSLVPLDPWGAIVRRRTVLAIWGIWAVGLVGHVCFWSNEGKVAFGAILPALVVASTRAIRGERTVWLVVGANVGLVWLCELNSVASVHWLSFEAFVAAFVLAVRAVRGARSVRAMMARGEEAVARAYAADAGPYRMGVEHAMDAETRPIDGPPTAAMIAAARASAARFAIGSAFALHLSAWTARWSGGPFPAHVLALDVGLILVVALVAWRERTFSALVPTVFVVGHGIVTTHVLPAPESLVGWGVSVVALGFVLLLGSLALSYRLRERSGSAAPPRPREGGASPGNASHPSRAN